MPFFPNAGNFVGSKEHDKNPRKFWFLVLTDGLYTKKTDADAVAGSSKIYIFFTRREARDNSVSSPSSLSPTSSEGVSHPHPFRDLAASASAPRPAPTRLRLPNRAPAATPEKCASAPFSPAARASAPGTSASAAPRARAVGSNSASNSRPPFLYNETSRKLYKSAQKAMQEMADTDSVQVVDYEDAVHYLSAGKGVGSN